MTSLLDYFARPEPVDVSGTPFADRRSPLAELFLGSQTGPQVRDPQAMRTDPFVFGGGGTAARTSDLAWDEALMSPGQRRAAEVMGSEPVSKLMMLANFLGPKAPMPAPKGIRAYHGSPHDFDRFDLSKIGTGEGAQAYGPGLYFGEAEATAKAYRDKLAHKGVKLRETVEGTIPGQTFTQNDLGAIYSAANHGDKDPLKAARGVQMKLPHLRDEGTSFTGPPSPTQQRIADAIAQLRDQGRGRMYEVNIKADPDQFLDWDVPLSQQSEKVRGALPTLQNKAVEARQRAKPDTFSADDAAYLRSNDVSVEDLVRVLGQDQAPFREAGIPGIRYKDAGSRGAEGGTSNYVVFDDSLVEILRKYGLAGILAGGASVAAPSDGDAAP